MTTHIPMDFELFSEPTTHQFWHAKLAYLRRKLLAGAALVLACGIGGVAAGQTAQEEQPDVFNGIDNITVIGTVQNADAVSGSISFIDPEELQQQNYGDINRVLRTVPGLNIQEEDGYGLRPNIGMRGSGADRSAKVLIMEDGVLMAPAPYAAPAAYYFPMVGRMNAVEITKGPATVRYGPNTTAGAIQLFSTPIPQDKSAYANVTASDLGHFKAHAWAGNRVNTGAFDVGFLLETFQDHADGFKDIEIGKTGFSIGDYVAKLGAYSHDGRQSLEFKFQYKDEVSNETYLGLSQADFDKTPNLRYNASQLDKLVSDHKTFQLTHNFDINDTWSLTNIAYRTEFARNWRKLDKFDNSQLSGSSDCNSLTEIVNNPVICTQEFAVLQGEAGYVSPDDVLQLRANNRTYYAQGIQSALRGQFDTGALAHDISISIRGHKDQVDRFQDQDGYRIDNSRLVLTTDNAPGTQANRLSDATAWSVYGENRMNWQNLTITAGLRGENVKARQDRWSTPSRTLAPSSTRTNSYTEWLPAISAKYDISDSFSVLGGVHKGFAAAPVSSRQSTDPEKSTVYEAGLRFRGSYDKKLSGLKLDAIGFFNDYANLLGACTNSSGGSECDIGDAFNAGQVDVKGLELTASATLDDIFETALSMPITVSYTLTDSTIKSSFQSNFWGDVTTGDELPYIPKHQFTLRAGLIADSWGLNTSLNLVSEARNIAGQGVITPDQLINGRTVVDASAYYQIKDGITLRLKAENIFDKTYIAARRPYGLRPGKPREIFAGLTLEY